MKKTLALALALLLILAQLCAPSLSAADLRRIECREMPFYRNGQKSDETVSLYFLDGVGDLPYIAVDEIAGILGANCRIEGDQAVFSYGNGYHMTLDYRADTIVFDDYDGFLMGREGNASTLLDPICMPCFNEAGEPALFEKNTDFSFDRYGDEITLKLSDYGIELVSQGGLYLAPIQTIVDFVIAPRDGMGFFYNGQAVILGGASDLASEDSPYYSAPKGLRSEALCRYGYGELCLMLDCLYGQKENHGIESFDQLFQQIGFDTPLLDPNPEEADLAIYYLINRYLDDLHSSFGDYSYLTDTDITGIEPGDSYTRMVERLNAHREARNAVWPDDGYPAYEEVGNTAYIAFDGFVLATANPEDYYASEVPQDTIGLIIKAHEQITRPDSPVENVVIDLSCNTGGAVDAAAFLLAWCLGEGSIAQKDTFTGAMSRTKVRADVNRDRAFDERDTIRDRNIFCLISPASFSCGNLVPSMFKESGRVTLLGRTSGGGSSLVMGASSAWGTSFRLSGPFRMSFLKNGSFYDIDRGVEPDFILTTPGKYYDREALTETINQLY